MANNSQQFNSNTITAATKSTNKITALSNCLVVGGAGFLGRNIAKSLLDKGCKIRVFDRVKVNYEHENLETIVAQLSDVEALKTACKDIDCVFHAASIIELGGGSAVSAEYRGRSFEVNVQGTQNVIDACISAGVKRLVYTSSNAVCFNGVAVTGLNSDSPYADNVYDMYTESKMEAEKLVLAANDKNNLLSCAIRPSGIYGPESNMMFDKFVENLSAGKLVVALGTPNAVHENSFIDNLVHAHILAAERLVEGNRICGRGYFICDNEFENYFDFFRPYIEGLGYKFPKFWLPVGWLIPIMRAWQWLHYKYGIAEPMMRPKELDKLATTHISDFREPQQDLDYSPLVSVAQAVEKCLPYCQQLHEKIKAKA